MSVDTAGTAAAAIIQVNDRFDTERGVGGDVLSVRLFLQKTRPANETCMIDCSLPGRAVHAVLVDNGNIAGDRIRCCCAEIQRCLAFLVQMFALLVQKHLLYEYKRTNTDAEEDWQAMDRQFRSD